MDIQILNDPLLNRMKFTDALLPFYYKLSMFPIYKNCSVLHSSESAFISYTSHAPS